MQVRLISKCAAVAQTVRGLELEEDSCEHRDNLGEARQCRAWRMEMDTTVSEHGRSQNHHRKASNKKSIPKIALQDLHKEDIFNSIKVLVQIEKHYEIIEIYGAKRIGQNPFFCPPMIHIVYKRYVIS